MYSECNHTYMVYICLTFLSCLFVDKFHKKRYMNACFFEVGRAWELEVQVPSFAHLYLNPERMDHPKDQARLVWSTGLSRYIIYVFICIYGYIYGSLLSTTNNI